MRNLSPVLTKLDTQSLYSTSFPYSLNLIYHPVIRQKVAPRSILRHLKSFARGRRANMACPHHQKTHRLSETP